MDQIAAAPMLPMGFADQVMDLEIKLDEEESLELIQILIQMYQIAVDYYLNSDVKKAKYFQNKLNKLAVKSLSAPSSEQISPKKNLFQRKIQSQMKRFNECQKTYLQSIVENAQKTQKKINEFVKADLNKQEENIRGRMLKRIKSTGKL